MLRDDHERFVIHANRVVSRRPKSARKASASTSSRARMPSASDTSKLAAGHINSATHATPAGGKRHSKLSAGRRVNVIQPIVASRQLPSKLAAGQIGIVTRGCVAGVERRSKRAQATVPASTKKALPASRALSKRAKANLVVSPRTSKPSALSLSRDEGGQVHYAAHSAGADLIAVIRETHKRRNDFLAEEGSLVRRMKRIVCRLTGKKKVSDADLKPYLNTKEPIYPPMVPFVHSVNMVRLARKAEEKVLKVYAEQLPVWPGFMQFIAGCGSLTLGQIIGEAGDLSKYSGPAKLWKRMGLALIGGERQRKCRDKEIAAAHGYNPRRRALMFIVGDNLIKLNKGEYRAIYDAEKKRQIEKAHAEGLKVAPAAKIPKWSTAEYRSEKHIHLRAKRYMEKRLLRNLWRAWRDLPRIDTSQRQGVSPAATHEAEAA